MAYDDDNEPKPREFSENTSPSPPHPPDQSDGSSPKPVRHSAVLARARASEETNEQSPLLAAARSKDREDEDVNSIEHLSPGTPRDSIEYSDNDRRESKSSWYLFLLTLSIGGLQIVWSVEMSNGSPYLLSLGMNKSLLAFVWIAGPLSGTLVQPYVGIRSDNCRISWGKRKPFMIAGGAATIIALMALAWTREIMGGICGIFGASPDSHVVKVSAIVFATIFMYTLDFAINTVQAGIRAFIVDNAPSHQQEDANAWAGRLTGIGNVMGYLSGYVDLPKSMPFFGNTQFKVLCVIASISLLITLLVSTLYIKERDPRLEGPPPPNSGIISLFKPIYNSARRMPRQIKAVCLVQLFNWIGWFPFMFYITTYIGQLYVNPIFESHPQMSDADINAVWEQATRMGTFALLIFAIVSLLFNVLLPFVVVPSYKPPPQLTHAALRRNSSHISIPRTPTTPGTLSTSMTDYFSQPHQSSSTGIQGLLLRLRIPGLTLRRAWLLSHILFAACMWSTIFVSTTRQATMLTAIVGICWALTLWAPFALISAEISKRDEERQINAARVRRFRPERRPRSRSHTPVASNSESNPYYTQVSTQDNSNANDDDALSTLSGEENDASDQAGIILGLHNVAIAAPQVIATLISSVVFRYLQKPRGTPGDDSVGWVLRIGGISALIAAYMCTRVGDGDEDRLEGENV
ncbi:MAG: hypothetical protein M1834_006184 [Cirrosporium novae-zelandiae]|nr:MAG: hypothetical protein M1834_006184 [Cirrosporium novae-zelandiae]